MILNDYHKEYKSSIISTPKDKDNQVPTVKLDFSTCMEKSR